MAGDSSLSGRNGIRGRLWTIIFEAGTKSGKAFDVLLLWAIGLSVVAVMLDSIDSFAMRWAELSRLRNGDLRCFLWLSIS